MAATRNRNTPGNYKLEQNAIHQWHGQQMYEHSAQGRPYETYLAGNGLIQGHMRGHALANNPTEIETMLFGIGSTDLTKNPEDVVPIKPDLKHLASMDLFVKPTIQVSRAIAPDTNARPAYLC
jgi:hypothetical protein